MDEDDHVDSLVTTPITSPDTSRSTSPHTTPPSPPPSSFFSRSLALPPPPHPVRPEWEEEENPNGRGGEEDARFERLRLRVRALGCPVGFTSKDVCCATDRRWNLLSWLMGRLEISRSDIRFGELPRGSDESRLVEHLCSASVSLGLTPIGDVSIVTADGVSDAVLYSFLDELVSLVETSERVRSGFGSSSESFRDIEENLFSSALQNRVDLIRSRFELFSLEISSRLPDIALPSLDEMYVDIEQVRNDANALELKVQQFAKDTRVPHPLPTPIWIDDELSSQKRSGEFFSLVESKLDFFVNRLNDCFSAMRSLIRVYSDDFELWTREKYPEPDHLGAVSSELRSLFREFTQLTDSISLIRASYKMITENCDALHLSDQLRESVREESQLEELDSWVRQLREFDAT